MYSLVLVERDDWIGSMDGLLEWRGGFGESWVFFQRLSLGTFILFWLILYRTSDKSVDGLWLDRMKLLDEANMQYAIKCSKIFFLVSGMLAHRLGVSHSGR
jgi:hypothetical protein